MNAPDTGRANRGNPLTIANRRIEIGVFRSASPDTALVQALAGYNRVA